jgi:uncharacterized protein YbjT (DUF2867 family)
MEITVIKTNKTALIFGATGLVGGHVLQQALAADAYTSVVAFTRGPLSITHPKLKNVVINFDKLGDYKKEIVGDDLFLCLGTTIKKAGSEAAFKVVDFDYPLAVAKMAKENGVNQVLLCSAVDADATSKIFYNRMKGMLEDALKALNFNALHIFQPSLLLGERNENRFGESVAKVVGKFLDKIIGGLLSKYRPVEGETVASAMVKSAQILRGGVFVHASHKLSKI